MGAEFFVVEAWGASPELAFDKVRREYGYQVGYAGYSGTIVEKNSFIIFPLPEGADPEAYAQKIAEEDPRIRQMGTSWMLCSKRSTSNWNQDNQEKSRK